MKEFLKELFEEPMYGVLVVYTCFFWIYAIVGMGYMSYHNFYMNTPERWSDPLNWIYGITVIAFGLGQRVIAKYCK